MAPPDGLFEETKIAYPYAYAYAANRTSMKWPPSQAQISPGTRNLGSSLGTGGA